MRPTGIAALSTVLPYWPTDVFGEPKALDKVGVRDFEVTATGDELSLSGKLVWSRELEIDLPIVKGLSVVLLSGNGMTEVPFQIELLPEPSVTIPNIGFGLRFRSDLLRPVEKKNGKWVPVLDSAGNPTAAELTFGGLGFTADLEGNIGFTGTPKGDLPPVQIGDSGVVVELQGLAPYLSSRQTPPANAPQSFRGVAIDSVTVSLPDDLDVPILPSSITAEDLFIGTGGFSGKLAGQWTPTFNAASRKYEGDGSGSLFGIPFALQSLAFEFHQNVPTESELKGELLLPYFDQRVAVDLSIGFDGAISLSLSAVQIAPAANTGGLLTFEKSGVIKVDVDSIGFVLDDGLFVARLSGKITPLVGNLNWPSFDIEELSIDSEGHVRVEGGWISLPTQYALDFKGFNIEITQLGLGKTDDGGKWIGFSGGVHLIGDMPAGASVEGLRVVWYPNGDTKLTLNGVTVDLEIPDVLKFHGHVAYRELPGGGLRFDGEIELELVAINLKVEAKLVIGRMATGEKFFAIFVGVELPAGIPVFSGISIYGMAGLVALQMSPNKKATESWFENEDGSPGWYKRDEPGVTDLAKKWDPKSGAKAFGAGLTFGTNDNGFTFSAKALIVIVFPGPLLLIEGLGNLLKERAKLDDDPLFRCLTVIDIGGGSMLIGLDARYRYGDGAELLDIRAGAEAFYDFKDASKWYINVGVDNPRSRRVRAGILSLFEANSYFMLDPRRVATGAWVGFDRTWQFGPLSMSIEAWIEGNARLSWKPAYFHGDLWLHGGAALRIFGVGLSLGVDAVFSADVFNPFHVVAGLSVSLDLPWPLKDYEADITLEWGPRKIAPRVPAVLKEVAIEHFKVTTSWPLARDGANALLLPNAVDADGYLVSASGGDIAPPAYAPRVPIDCRPHVTFGRTVHDDAGVGINAQPPWPDASPAGWEWIGDPSRNEGAARVRYSLREIKLQKHVATTWRDVARAGPGANAPNVRPLFGSWAPVPQLPSGGAEPGSTPAIANTKLWLWSRTPFDYTRNTGSAYDDWFAAAHPDYPCIPAPHDRAACRDFARESAGTRIAKTTCGEEVIRFDREGVVRTLDEPVRGFSRALCFSGIAERAQKAMWPGGGGPSTTNNDDSASVRITLAQPAKSVRLVFGGSAIREEHVVDFGERVVSEGTNPYFDSGVELDVRGADGRLFDRTSIVMMKTNDGPLRALACGRRLDIILPCAGTSFEIVVARSASRGGFVPAILACHLSDGTTSDVIIGEPGRVHTVRFTMVREPITHLSITSKTDDIGLHRLRFDCSVSLGPTATAFDTNNVASRPFYAQENVIEIAGDAISELVIDSRSEICLVEMCVTMGPSAEELKTRDALAQRMKDALTRWSAVGDVLEPYSSYRLRIETGVDKGGFDGSGFNGTASQVEYAYFKTDGPPGLANFTLPPNAAAERALIDRDGHFVRIDGMPSATPVLATELSSLAPYVRQTIPPTVGGFGEKPLLPRPVYCAYDCSVVFNEDYVDLMYRMAGRDLGIYLFDANDRPARDVDGALVIPQSTWGRAATVTLTEGEKRWVETVNASNCAAALAVDETKIQTTNTILQSAERIVLDADTLYEARLLPLLMHDDFNAYAAGTTGMGPTANVGRWTVRDGTSATVPSKWTFASGNVTESVAVSTYLFRADDPALDASHAEQPLNWTDYRFSAILRASDPHGFGLLFRWRDSSNFYGFLMDASASTRLLARRVNGVVTVLASDGVAFDLDRDYLVAAEAIGSRLRILVDGVTLFDLDDSSHSAGSVGFYSGGNPAASFADARVQDFRQQAIPAYRFRFVTSRFANFFHHLHSFNDETWPVILPPTADIGSLAAQMDETRAYTALAKTIFAADAERTTERVEIERVGGTLLHVRTSEPIDWSRTTLELRYAATAPGATVQFPRTVKMTSASFNDDAVTLLMREATDVSGWTIQWRSFTPDWQPWFTFPANEHCPAGSRVRIHAGTSAPQEHHVLQRFTGTPAAFGSGPVELQLLAADGRVIHARHFLAERDYAAVPAQVLRRHDGTAFFILPSTLAPGAYRLNFVFHRDNRGTDAKSLVLSEGGSTTPELVELDFELG
jgi:hypothetical protein